jgi:hypothetical protein
MEVVEKRPGFATALRATRWNMLGVVALVGVGLLLLAFRYAPRPSGVVDGQYPAGQLAATQSVGPTSERMISATPSPGMPPAASGYAVDPSKTVAILQAGCACADDVEVTATLSPQSGGGVADTMQVVAHVWLHSWQGGFDYSPALFKFRAKNGRLYAPVTTNAFGPPLVAGALARGQSASGVLVFDVPIGSGAIELVDNTNTKVYDWPLPSPK